MIRIVLVDDHRMVRQVVRARLGLEPDLLVVGEAENGEQALARMPQWNPDLVLLDINLPGLDGISVATSLRQSRPGCAIVMLSMEEDPALASEASQAGAAAFVSKYHILDQLVGVIRQVLLDLTPSHTP